MNLYFDPEKFGLETIGEIQWGEADYSFDLTVVWKRLSDGYFVYCEDSGCSCPSPFEDKGIEDLTVLRKRGGLNAFKAHGDQMPDVVELLERMHKAGAR